MPDAISNAIKAAQNFSMSSGKSPKPGPSLNELRTRFDGLSPDQQSQATDTFLLSLRDPSAPKSEYANLLSAIGIGSDLID